jgi:hypothetical protein
MTDGNATMEELRGVAAELKRRRNRIAKVQRSLAVVEGAYSLVIADLHAAYGEGNACDEPTTPTS